MDILGLKKANCKNCYKCIRECPIKSIEFSNQQAKIINNDCILCGRCVVACPQNAKQVRSDLSIAMEAINKGKNVIVSLAPSFVSEFDFSIEQFSEKLRVLGVNKTYETAEGAYIVKTEYENIISQNKQDVIISSCCHSVIKLIQKYYPNLINYIAPVVSPMHAHAKYIKSKISDAYVIFIGPCISKKDEIEKYATDVDLVLTFDELREWCLEKNVSLNNENFEPDDGRVSRFFPQVGGIIKSMKKDNFKYIAVDGVENCISVLKEIQKGNLKRYFIEMSTCNGGCINGPATKMYCDNILDCENKVNEYSSPNPSIPKDFNIDIDFSINKKIASEFVEKYLPSEQKIKEILEKMGKTKQEHELNCGTCGYPTCRDKAISVYWGKSDPTMCLPFMKEKAESFSNNIISITPNAIIVMDEELRIQQINESCCKMFNFPNVNTIIGASIVEIMDPTDFVNIMYGKEIISEKKCYIAEYNKYVEQSIMYDKEHHIIIGIMKDITDSELSNEAAKEIRNKTIEITDKVIEKQMRVVQEIASLLGETTAETKIALTKIKNTMFLQDTVSEDK